MTLSRACALSPIDSLALLEFVWMRGLQDLKSGRWSVAKLVHSEPHYYRREFSRAMVQAIRRPDLAMVQWLRTHFKDCRIPRKIVEEAAKSGLLWVLQLLDGDIKWKDLSVFEKNGRRFYNGYWCNHVLDQAAEQGHWGVVRWLDKRICTSWIRQQNHYLVNHAFEQDNALQVKWWVAKGFPVSSLRFSSSKEGWRVHTEIVRYLLEGGHGDTTEIACDAMLVAVRIGDVEFVEWLRDHFLDGNERYDNRVLVSAMDTAIRNGHLLVVDRISDEMLNRGLQYKQDLSEGMFFAAAYGHLQVVRWLYEQSKDDPNVCLFRLRRQTPQTRRKLIPSNAMDAAAKFGHLEVVQFLHHIDLARRDTKDICWIFIIHDAHAWP